MPQMVLLVLYWTLILKFITACEIDSTTNDILSCILLIKNYRQSINGMHVLLLSYKPHPEILFR